MKNNIGFFPATDKDIGRLAISRVLPINCKDEFTWSVNGKLIDPKFEFDKVNIYENYNLIIDKLKNYEPIFSRYYDCLPEIDLLYRELALTCLCLAEALNSNFISCVIFTTASSHHIDSILCELACQISGIKQIFLYNVLSLNRLIPMIQTNGIETRTPSKYYISDYVFTNQKLESNSLVNLNNNMVPKSFFLSLINILRSFANIKIVRNNFKFNYNPNLRTWRLTTTLRLLFIHRKANKTLRMLINQDSEHLSDIKSQPKIVVYAHFVPEATNFPEGGKFHNPIDLIIKIRSLGYLGHIIFKEHPDLIKGSSSKSGAARTSWFYLRLRNLGCLFVDSSYLPSDNDLVVTLTGTIAIERSLLAQKTIVMGHIWFKDLRSIVSLESALNYSDNQQKFTNDKHESINSIYQILNNRTINNATGIGTGKPSSNKNDWENYYNEMRKLINYL